MSAYSSAYGSGASYNSPLTNGGSGGNARTRKERKVSVIFRHTDSQQHCTAVESLLLSPSGNWLFTASRDSTIKRWNISTHHPTFEASFEGHVDWVNDVAVLEDSLVSCSNDRTVKIWKASSPGQWVHTFMHHSDYVTSLAGIPSNGSVATAGLRSQVSIIDLNAVKAYMVYPKTQKLGAGVPPKEPGSIYGLAASADGNLLAAGTTQSLVRVLDARTGGKIMKLRGHTDNVRCVALNADGTMLLSGSTDKTIRLWDLGQQRCVQTIAAHTDSVWALLASDNFTTVYSAGRDKCVYRTMLPSRSSQLLLMENHPISRMAMNFSDGSLWVSTTSSTVHRWNTADASPPSEFRSVSGRNFVVGSSAAARLRQSFDLTHAGSSNIPEPLLSRPASSIAGVPGIVAHAILPDRRSLLTKDSDGNVAVWDVLTGTTRQSLGKTDLAKAERSLFQPLSVPSWFTADHKLGCITLHLETPAAFGAEVYASELGYQQVMDDAKVNYGKLVLDGLFHRWAALHAKFKAAEADALRQTPGALVLEDIVEEEKVPRFNQQWPKYWESPILPAVACQSAMGVWNRWVLNSFTGGEKEGEDVPQWVADAVLHNIVPSTKDLKSSFVLQPAEGSDLPSLLQSRLNAPRILQVHKVATYCTSKLAEINIVMQLHTITWNPQDNIPPPGPVNYLEVTCNGVLVPFEMSLSSVREFIWKKREDVVFHYRKLDRNNMPPLPKIQPPS